MGLVGILVGTLVGSESAADLNSIVTCTLASLRLVMDETADHHASPQTKILCVSEQKCF